jgi:hypothetical protein
MRNKALIIVLLIVLLGILALCITAAINGGMLLYYSIDATIFDYFPFAQSLIRTLSLLAFTLIYCKTWYSGESPGSAFTDLYLLAAALVETRVFNDYTNLTGICFVPPVVLSRLLIASVILMLLSIISSALYYQNNEYGAVSLLKGLDTATAIIMGLLLPVPLSFENLFLSVPTYWIFIILCATAFLACLILMLTDPPGIGTFKHLSSILIVGGIFAIFFFNITYADLVGSILLTLGYTANAILSASNSIRL